MKQITAFDVSNDVSFTYSHEYQSNETGAQIHITCWPHVQVPFCGTTFIKFGQLNLGHAHRHIHHALKHAWPQKPISFLFRKESRLKYTFCSLCLNCVYFLHANLADPKEGKEIFVSNSSYSKWHISSVHFKLQLTPKCIKELNTVVITCQDLRVWLQKLQKKLTFYGTYSTWRVIF